MTISLCQWWKFCHPEAGLAIGTPLWSDPSYTKGLLCDWAHEQLKGALAFEAKVINDQHALLQPGTQAHGKDHRPRPRRCTNRRC